MSYDRVFFYKLKSEFEIFFSLLQVIIILTLCLPIYIIRKSQCGIMTFIPNSHFSNSLLILFFSFFIEFIQFKNNIALLISNGKLFFVVFCDLRSIIQIMIISGEASLTFLIDFLVKSF